MKKIGMYNRNMNQLVMEFDSIDDACDHTGVAKTVILNALDGRDDQACGFSWRYIEE